jgi:hypothetical protein
VKTSGAEFDALQVPTQRQVMIMERGQNKKSDAF